MVNIKSILGGFMVIGVDAGAISSKDEQLNVGVYRVTRELLQHLSFIDTTNTYRLYSFSPIPKDTMKEFGANMINIPLTPSTGYMKIRLPIELTVRPVDMFLGLSQALPFGVKKAIGFIYDLGFLHHPELYGKQAGKLAKQTKQVVSLATRIVTISKASKEDIQKTYCKSSTVAYPGVSDVFTKNKEKMQHPVPYFLMVGVNPSKNIPIAMRAFYDFMKRTKKKYDLIIIGGSVRIFLQKNVHFLGYVPDAELAKWYTGATALVALSETEGFCLPAVEALASGCPVIYTQNGVLPEIVDCAGMGVSIKNIHAITDAMMKLTKEKIKTTAQAEKYSWETFASSVLFLINRVSKENTGYRDN